MNTQDKRHLPTPRVVRLSFHQDAEDMLIEVSTAYSRKVDGFAEQLAVNENAAEVQPGHVERAQLTVQQVWRQRSDRRAALKGIAQIVGSGLLSIGASGIAFNSAQTVSAALIWIAIGAFGLVGVVVGVMMKG